MDAPELPFTPAQAQANGNVGVSRRFTPAPQSTRPGRPCLPIKKRGPKLVVAKPVTAEVPYAAVVMGAASLPVQPDLAVTASINHKRCNWSKGAALERLTKAKEDWLNKSGDLLTAQPDMSLTEFSRRVGIPSSTLHKYAHSNVSQRQRLGSSAGKPPLVDEKTAQLAVDVLRRDDGMNNREAIGMVNDLMPSLSRRQANQSFHRTILPAWHCSEVNAQASTSKRSAIPYTIPYPDDSSQDSDDSSLEVAPLPRKRGWLHNSIMAGEVVPNFRDRCRRCDRRGDNHQHRCRRFCCRRFCQRHHHNSRNDRVSSK